MTSRPVPDVKVAYQWPPSNDQIASDVGLYPSDILRFDGNVSPAPPASARPATVARALADVNEYDRGRYRELREAIATHHGVATNQVVLGAGSDELIVVCARTFAAGGTVATVPVNSYSMYRFAAGMADAQMVPDPASADLVYVCRPNNPTGELPDVPEVDGQLVIDEAYAEYAGVDALDHVESGAIILRTFSKAHGLAGARVGYAICDQRRADILSSRLAPLSVSSLSAGLALASLRDPPDVSAQVQERERLRSELATLGLHAERSYTNFLYVPTDTPDEWRAALLPHGVVIRCFPGAIRISVRDRDDDDVLLDAIRAVKCNGTVSDSVIRHRRVTAETRIDVRLRLRGDGRVLVDTGSGLYDHLLQQLAFHGGLDLRAVGVGDHETGDHHTVEDLMRSFGDAFDRALGDRRGITRYGESRIPMDEALAHAVIDLSGRPVSRISIVPDPGMATHALDSFAQNARLTLHVDATGDNSHHVAEGAFKAVGRALAVALSPSGHEVPSSKGSL
jgi:histidinol-phosphate/aromatic aminotransferase/cobyric acid decarboxylase-like protein/imidazoleglycerol phosphate dehydratase HisB